MTTLSKQQNNKGLGKTSAHVSSTVTPQAGAQREDLSALNVRLQALQNILDEHGKAHKGMKTRQFIGMFRALNTLGLFANFSANDKEVRATLAPTTSHPTGAHLLAHTGHGGQDGLSARTAREASHLIQAMKNAVTVSISTKN